VNTEIEGHRREIRPE